jgi:hypothetical protein
MLICSERKILLAGYWWLIWREKYYWLVADKPNEQGGSRETLHCATQERLTTRRKCGSIKTKRVRLSPAAAPNDISM